VSGIILVLEDHVQGRGPEPATDAAFPDAAAATVVVKGNAFVGASASTAAARLKGYLYITIFSRDMK
jgi:hypothetical protein